MVDLGDLRLFLGMQMTRDRVKRTLFLDQERYITKILEHCKMDGCYGCHTPMDTKLVLAKPSLDKII